MHWSFFFNSFGSLLEGNQILQKSSSSFLTTTPFTGFSNLDLYLMGFVPASSVSGTFYVDSPSQFSPSYAFQPQSTPEAGVGFHGNAIPVAIGDVIAANDARNPDAISSQKQFRDLFVLITTTQTPATAAETSYLELVRSSWEAYFSNVTKQKASIRTSLK